MRICTGLLGAIGWAGSELARGIAAAPDFERVGAVSRTPRCLRICENLRRWRRIVL
jgi:hypothetical protein